MNVMTDDAFVRLFQERGGLTVDGWAGLETQALLDQLLPPAPAPESDIPDDYWPMLSKIESEDRPYIKSPWSSASGLYQFIKATRLAEGGSWDNDRSEAFG